MSRQYSQDYDVVIVGGSYAGLSAGLALGRSLRKTLLMDGGRPCNASSPHSHNFITHDGTPPAQITTAGREQLARYSTLSFYQGRAIAATKTDEGFVIKNDREEEFRARMMILATGLTDVLPEIPGFKECWGISVIHCPYCHGYEYRGQKTGILARGDKALHLVPLVHNLSPEISILTMGTSGFTEEQERVLREKGVQVVTSPVTAIHHQSGQVVSVVLESGREVPFSAIYAPVPFEQASDIPASLGCAFTDSGHIETDVFQKTNIPGVFACGDAAVPLRSVAQAVASGNVAGAVANMELAQEHYNQI